MHPRNPYWTDFETNYQAAVKATSKPLQVLEITGSIPTGMAISADFKLPYSVLGGVYT